MQLLVGRRVVERPDGLAESFVLRGVDLVQRGRVGDRRHRLLERVQEREVPIAVERGDQLPPRRAPAALQSAEELAAVCTVVAERLNLRCEVLDQDVEVPHRAECPAQPLQLLPHGLDPLGVEQLAAGPQERPQPPGRDPHLVQLLRVGAEPRPWIVGEHALDLLPDAGAQRRGARGVVGRADQARPGSRGRVPGRPSGGVRRPQPRHDEAPSRSAAASSRRRRAARPRAPRSCG